MFCKKLTLNFQDLIVCLSASFEKIIMKVGVLNMRLLFVFWGKNNCCEFPTLLWAQNNGQELVEKLRRLKLFWVLG